MHDVQGGAGDGGGADDLADRLDARAGFETPEAADMREYRHVPRRGNAKHVDHLEAARAGGVLNAHADAQRPGIQFPVQPLLHPLDLLRRRRLVGRRTRLRQYGGIMNGRTERQRASGKMARGRAVVDQGAALFLLQKCGDIRHADFHFQRGGNAVEGFEAAARGVLPMLVQVDEAGRDDESLDVDDAFAGERLRRDPRHLALGNTDVADRIETGLRIHYAPAAEHDVVGLCEYRRGEDQANAEYE